jgi:7-cyano-7-deazaguanine synthase
MRSAVVLLSGGLDSATAAALARRDGYALYGLTVHYGQVHAREIEAARRVAAALGFVKHVELDIDLRAIGGSSLLGEGEIPKDRIGDLRFGDLGIGEGRVNPVNPQVPHSANPQMADIPSTYVPARNTILLSLALGWAEVLGADRIVIGVNALDYSGYPDCRPEYLAAFEYLATLATRAGVGGRPLRIWAPLQHLTKAAIIRAGLELGLDYGMTHSCYDPGPDGRPCGHCDSCQLRARGFAEVGVLDPVLSR